ncbi:MAG: class I SAM-dependent DNA methyltransferase [Dehalococcoidia bacterium]|nr:class I SAM-dependent DNA methyltransferase [Dehalococcoidia bacterium]
MPILSREDAAEVEALIERVFDVPRPERPGAIRQLFAEALDFDPAQGQVSLDGARSGTVLPNAADRIAALDGVHVLYVALDAPSNGRVRQADATEAARLIADQLGDDLLLVFTNAGVRQLQFVLPDLTVTRPTLRRMVVERDLPQRTAVEQIAGIYWNHRDSGNIRTALDQAFDVEPVTKRFFKEYKRVFDRALELVTGFEDDEDRRMFVQTLFNRLMFVYFLQRKGWLEFGGDKEYLRALWNDYQATPEQKNFHNVRLRSLFFFGLNNEQSRDFTDRRRFSDRYIQSLIDDPPFLNGGLFERGDLDGRDGVTVPDEAIEAVLNDLFEKFNFTVMESTPFDIEVAVDPEMLGKVFEELVTGRHDSGAYYTPRSVVSFMSREALKGYLEARDTGLTTDVIAAFVDEQRTDGIDVAAARRVAAALGDVTVVDPACGSGAYLVGMMQELVELQTALYNAGVDERTLHALKLEIIQRNLYGVDIDGFAVNIAMLRLWLSLAIEYEGDRPEPLPNLDFKIMRGDSLLEPDPRDAAPEEGAGQLGLVWAADDAGKLRRLKDEYLSETRAEAKKRLRAEIEAVKAKVREAMGSLAPPEGAFDWWVEYNEVFAERGGFDVVLANPPYIQLRKDQGRLRKLYADTGYDTLVNSGDIYELFYERGCQLLRETGGLLAYITSNGWLRAQHGKRLRRYFTERHEPLRWLDLGKDIFEAIVDSGVLLLRTSGGKGEPFPAVDMDRVPGTAFPPPSELWGAIRPDGDAPWSVLSRVEQEVMEKMREKGTPLGEWDVTTSIGVFTGYNEAFIIDEATRDDLIAEDPKSAEILKPILRARPDIRRYRAEWAGRWLIYSHRDVAEGDYPSVRRHLARHKGKLARRRLGANPRTGKVPYGWWQLAVDNYNSGLHRNLNTPKLFWADMSARGRFAYSESAEVCDNTCYILAGAPAAELKYLCALLNSAAVASFMRGTTLTTGLGVPRWQRFAVERIPVPRISAEEQRPYVELVDRIIEAKDADADADTEEWERAIDRLVYDLYGLTDEEDTAVERALGLIHPTDEAEDAAILQTMLERAGDAGDSVSRDTVMATLRAPSGA